MASAVFPALTDNEKHFVSDPLLLAGREPALCTCARARVCVTCCCFLVRGSDETRFSRAWTEWGMASAVFPALTDNEKHFVSDPRPMYPWCFPRTPTILALASPVFDVHVCTVCLVHVVVRCSGGPALLSLPSALGPSALLNRWNSVLRQKHTLAPPMYKEL
jgi:hypothetical protein